MSRSRIFLNPPLRVKELLCFVMLFALTAGGHAFTQVDAKAAQDAARLNNLGTAYMGQQMLDRAAQNFAQAYKEDPKLFVAQINLGIALLYLQKIPEAEKALAIAEEKAPRDPHTWYALGLLYRNENDSQRALDAFNKVVALDPTDPDAHYMVGSVQMDMHKLPEAVAEFREALQIQPSNASAAFGLARVLQRQGNPAEAREAFQRFQQITGAKLGSPLTHTYGEEGKYGRVENASVDPQPVGPMIPVMFKEAWRSTPSAIEANVAPGITGGACLIDLRQKDDANGREMDLVILGQGKSAVRLYRNDGSNRFEALTPEATGIHIEGQAVACAVGDYDNDGLPDLAVAMSDKLLLFRNLGTGRFEEVTQKVGLEPGNMPSSVIFVDYDHDGDLDLFVTGSVANGTGPSVLWRNNGNGTFTNWTKEAGLAGSAKTNAATLSDLNNDRAVDLVVTGEAGAPAFFANRREGAFLASPLFPENLSPAVGVVALDFNKDGWMDVLLTHSGAPGVTLWRNVNGTRFERVSLPLESALSGTGITTIDFDNDGWIDLAMLVQTKSGAELRVLRNMGPAGFSDVTSKLGLDKLKLANPQSLTAADFDHDGDTDLLITQADGTVLLLRNDGGNKNHQLKVALKGLADNKEGIGAKIEVFADGLWQKWEETGQPEIAVGLGSAEKADLVRLLWPTGVPQDEIDLAAGKLHVISELDRRGSSCPTLFAWDGARYRFIADVIGAGVVGHWVSPTKNNTPDPDEWIKVDGSQIRERNGLYSLRFGEPMEEVNFVDQVRLVAVDHPASTGVYPNEGFRTEPPFASGETIQSKQARPLAGAWDDRGEDVRNLLRWRDRQYVKDFKNLPFAGFANVHTLTLDIGAWSPQSPLRLLLHGFVEYFSASSMYSASQAGLSPVPPFVEAEFADGTWHKVVEDMGFPAGLPRTVVVDLTGKLPSGIRRIRITTNLQIYWDQALVDNTPRTSSQVRQYELPITSAHLAFRGYPRQLDGKTPGDLTYNYQSMSPSGPFVPHRGAYTRYGDVTPLLKSVDDEYVIFGTGEDMDLEFSGTSLPPLPNGWKRDFFFYANGFVKDMDFYEASPFLVGALPFHGMSTYPYATGEEYPTDDAHTSYQLEWNTRFESGSPEHQYQFHYSSTPVTGSSRPTPPRSDVHVLEQPQ